MNNKTALVSSIVAVLAMLLLSGWAWTVIPESQPIPLHYGLNGLPDRYGGKVEGLLLLPAIAAVTALLFAAIPSFESRGQNLLRSAKAYTATWIGAIALLALVHGAIVFQAMGWPIDVVTVTVAGLGILLLVIGNYLGKTRSNHSFGVRTPWTLASESVWNKTNRLGGRLLFGLGLACVIAAVVQANRVILLLAIGGTLGVSLILVGYSYLLWKGESAQEPIER